VPEVLIALGGNTGPVRATLDRAVVLLCDGHAVALLARSSDYQTPPWGVRDQPDFVNSCLKVATNLSPRALLERAQAVERTLGRDRTKEQRFGPRPVDIDVLAYDDLRIEEPGLTLPHPRVLERASSPAFVCATRSPPWTPAASSGSCLASLRLVRRSCRGIVIAG